MAKYQDLMESPWINATIYPESIPHLLHYDLAYLWILEKQADQRPKAWQDRIEGWRCLVELLLTGELDITQEPIRDPLLKYTRPYGITSIYWVAFRGAGKIVGTLSPAVLIRPLPDFDGQELKEWRRELSQRHRPDDFRYFVDLAIDYLRQTQIEESFRSKLADILEKEFASKSSGVPHAGAAGKAVTLPLLTHLFWTQKPTESSCVEDFDILVKGDGDGRVFIPRCMQCNYLLTKPANAQPVVVQGETFFIECENPSDRHMNELKLSDYLIWVRSEAEVILWERQPMVTAAGHVLPPEPTVQGINIRFEWNPAQLGGERAKRFINLQFPNMAVSQRRVEDIFFKKVLVPGSFENFKGLPVRPDWLDALANPGEIRPDADAATSKITYRNMLIKGWPNAVTWTFSGRFSISHEPDLAVGLYPDPQYVPADWQWYRMLLHGVRRRDYEIKAGYGRQILPWLRESTSGLRDYFSVSSSADGNVGSTFWVTRQHKTFSSTASARINLGIDFGTTNTIVYYLPPGKNIDHVLKNPSEFCFKPAEVHQLVHWLACPDDMKSNKPVGDFLPGSDYLKDRTDPHITPSSIWHFGDEYLIRWDAERPVPAAMASTGFKWDEDGIDRSLQRMVFIRELLFMVIPRILKSSIDSQSMTTWNFSFHIAFTFPLAFGSEDRDRMSAVYKTIGTEFRKMIPKEFKFVFNSINESSACKILLGGPNPTDTFLVADMGGGTIDLALFTGDNKEADQIGSIRFAGETFLKVLVEKRGIPEWEIRDLISEGRCHHHYGGDSTTQRILNRFIAVAFEFLRTMIEAYRKEKPDQLIHLVLAGNGWHLVEAFSRETGARTPKQVFSDYYEHVVKQMHDKRIRQRDPIPTLESNKHLVAIGALKHAAKASDEPNDELKATHPTLSKLPAGRGLKFGDANNGQKIIKWSDLVGDKLPFDLASGDELRRVALEVDFNDMPPLPKEWRSFLLHFFNISDERQIPPPDEMIIREQVRESISTGVPPRISKGPLQITIEQHWVEWLKK